MRESHKKGKPEIVWSRSRSEERQAELDKRYESRCNAHPKSHLERPISLQQEAMDNLLTTMIKQADLSKS
jgi:hypothetical protein